MNYARETWFRVRFGSMLQSYEKRNTVMFSIFENYNWEKNLRSTAEFNCNEKWKTRTVLENLARRNIHLTVRSVCIACRRKKTFYYNKYVCDYRRFRRSPSANYRRRSRHSRTQTPELIHMRNDRTGDMAIVFLRLLKAVNLPSW